MNALQMILRSEYNANDLISEYIANDFTVKLRGCPRGVMVKELDCGIVVSDFEL